MDGVRVECACLVYIQGRKSQREGRGERECVCGIVDNVDNATTPGSGVETGTDGLEYGLFLFWQCLSCFIFLVLAWVSFSMAPGPARFADSWGGETGSEYRWV